MLVVVIKFVWLPWKQGEQRDGLILAGGLHLTPGEKNQTSNLQSCALLCRVTSWLMNDSTAFPVASWEITHCEFTLCVCTEINGSRKGCDRERNELNR